MSKHEDFSQSGKIEWIKVDDLQRDPTVNIRPIDERRSQKMADELDIDALGVIEIWRRPDLVNVIIDGQHRCDALKKAGFNGDKIACKVFANMTRAQAAARFILLNTQSAVRSLDKFLARVTAKDKIAVAIDEIVRQCGYVVDRQSRDGVIVAARAIEDIYVGKNQKIEGKNPHALIGTLNAVTEAWGRTKHSVNANVLTGIGAFLLRYGGHVKLDRLIEKMKSVHGGPQGLVARGTGKRELHGGTLASGIGHHLTDEYNRGLKGKGRLPAWRSEEE